MNQSGVLEIRADKIVGQTAFGRIIEAVERAERSRARFADRSPSPVAQSQENRFAGMGLVAYLAGDAEARIHTVEPRRRRRKRQPYCSGSISCAALAAV